MQMMRRKITLWQQASQSVLIPNDILSWVDEGSRGAWDLRLPELRTRLDRYKLGLERVIEIGVLVEYQRRRRPPQGVHGQFDLG